MTDDKIDDLLNKLDDLALDIDPYESGLPLYGKYKEKLREIVREWITTEVEEQP